MSADPSSTGNEHGTALRRGWTTGACATAATKSALSALLGAGFPDPVTITLPKGQTPSFALAHERLGDGFAEAGIVKDAGDDPDVTHGATIVAHVARGKAGQGVTFHAGEGVGTVTKPGLPLDVGDPAINPVPREMMRGVVEEVCAAHGIAGDIAITISVPGGADIAQKTWNPRLGIMGGLSILGTTGIVVPYSCSAWIHSIQRGIDVARALGLQHVCGATGDRSEKAARATLGLAEEAYLDMGDFVGGMLKYLKKHPVPRVTIAGGFGKLTKLAQGAMDLHSGRSQVDIGFLVGALAEIGAAEDTHSSARECETAAQVLALAQEAGLPLGDHIARKAAQSAQGILDTDGIQSDVMIVDRKGKIVGRSR